MDRHSNQGQRLLVPPDTAGRAFYAPTEGPIRRRFPFLRLNAHPCLFVHQKLYQSPLEAVFEAPSPDPRQTQLIPILVTGTWEQREAQDKEFVLKPPSLKFLRTKALEKRMGNPLTEIPRPQP